MRYLILATILSACVDQAPTTQPIATEQCGDYPTHGHYTVTYEQRDGVQVAVLTRQDFDAMVAERSAAKEWAYCVAGSQP